jgi:hypothetical protein
VLHVIIDDIYVDIHATYLTFGTNPPNLPIAGLDATITRKEAVALTKMFAELPGRRARNLLFPNLFWRIKMLGSQTIMGEKNSPRI